MSTERITAKQYLFNILNGVALAVIVGLVPNAIFGSLFGYLAQYNDIFLTLKHVFLGIQFSIPVITGVLIALQFKLTPLQTVIVGAASLVGSGSMQFKDGVWVVTGIGDLINTMITAAIAVGILLLLKDKLGSISIILLPILSAGIAGFIGLLTLPYVKTITLGIGLLINSITNVQPIIMTTLIAIIFSIVIISPISTVALGIAVGITGLAGGAAALGVAAATMVLFVGTIKVNKAGVPMAVILGAMKMMLPNMVRSPILLLPVIMNGAVTGLIGGLLNMQATPETAGFGLVGLVGPISSFTILGSGTATLFSVFIAYILVPLLFGTLFHYLCVKFKIYDPEIFRFKTTED